MRKSRYPVMTYLFVHYIPTRGHCFFDVTALGASASWWWFWNWSQSYLVHWAHCRPGVQSLGYQAVLHSEGLSLLKSFKCRHAQRPEEGVWSPGAGVASVWLEPPWVLGPQLGSSGWTVHALTTEPSLTLQIKLCKCREGWRKKGPVVPKHN